MESSQTFALLSSLDTMSPRDGHDQQKRLSRGHWTTQKAQRHIIKFSLPTKIHSLPQNAPFASFSFFAQTSSFFDQAASLFSQPSTFTRAIKMPWFRWKEMDELFTIAVSLLPQRTQPMEDNYQGPQSRLAEAHTDWRTISSC